jgi:dipeptidyl aminopeptidase/acylaminoacyl peptidase
MHRRHLVVALFAVPCSQHLQAQAGVTSIPRFAGQPDSAEARYVGQMPYAPRDEALAWVSADTLFVSHTERFAAGDVSASTCQGSGIYAIALAGGGARPIGVGEPACHALDGALDPASRTIFASSYLDINRSQLIRIVLPHGPIDTLPTGCQVYADDPELSADGRALVFRGLCADRKQEHWQIYVVGVDGSGLRQLPGEPGYDAESARLSADRRRIAYVRGDDIVIVDSAGTGRRILARGAAPAWSPDGQWIAYLPSEGSRSERGSVHVIRSDGSAEREVFQNRERSTFSDGWGDVSEGRPLGRIVWSPDGQWIAFSRVYARGISVWKVNLKTGEVRQVTRPDR